MIPLFNKLVHCAAQVFLTAHNVVQLLNVMNVILQISLIVVLNVFLLMIVIFTKHIIKIKNFYKNLFLKKS